MRVFAPLLVILIIAVTPLTAYARDSDPFADRLQAQMPELLDRYHVPGAVVAYIRDGDVAWTEAYGVADLRSGAAMQPEMIMNFGSCGKVLTAWGVMRLVESGAVDLDAPANRYLKRWQIPSGAYDANQVTVRRLLAHTGGLTVHGYTDYSLDRRRPSLVEMLEGKNQLDGRVTVQWQPGTGFHYSGGGYVLLQMIIEDVSGEPFEVFLQREVVAPLGLTSLAWTWNPELMQAAAVPHGSQGEPVGYRQLASQAIGSEISTAADFARFVAAAVEGPNGEPPGRGVLSPDSVRAMTGVQPGNGAGGLAYGLSFIDGDKILSHYGSNIGWNAFFILDTVKREGLVMAVNSANGFELLTAVQDLWTQSLLMQRSNVYPPASDLLGFQGRAALLIAAVLGAAWLLTAALFIIQLRSGKRHFSPPRQQLRQIPRLLSWVGLLPWLLLALFWWYWLYAPVRGLLPTTFPDLWQVPQTALVMIVLFAWVVLSSGMALFPRLHLPVRIKKPDSGPVLQKEISAK